MRKKETQKHCNSQPSPSPSPTRSISPLRLHRSPSRASPLSKALLHSLQSELRSHQGCSLSPGSIPFLGHYCESHRLLRSVLSTREHPCTNDFLREYSRLHSQQRVGKLYNLVMDHEHQMRRNSKLYSRQCLADYFQLPAFTEERLVTTLVKIVAQGRAKGLIEVQERRKKKRTHYQLDEKENRTGKQLRGACKFQETKVYFAILTLKLLLKEPQLNSEKINRSCEEIKTGLEDCLRLVKLRQEGIKSTRSSIFRRL